MEIRDLKIFIAVAQNNSISKAANQLHYVQSNITARIKHLEEQLETSLFHRSSKGVSMTSAGELLLDYAHRIVQLEKEAESVIKDRSKPRGKLSIGTMETTAAVRLPQLLSDYHRAFPDVELNLLTGPSQKSMERLTNFQVDGALVAGEVDSNLWSVEKAYEEELVVVSPPELKHISELTEFKILVFRSGCSYRAQLERWLHSTGKSSFRVIEFGSIEGILGCVAAGMGITFLPRSVVEKTHILNKCAIHPIDENFGQMTTWFVRRRNELPNKAMQAFIEMISIH